MSMGATPPVLVNESGFWPIMLPESAKVRYAPVKQSSSRPVGAVSNTPPRQIFVGPVLVPSGIVIVRLMKLSTSMFPVPSGVEERTAWIGAEPQFRRRGALL